MSTLDNLIDREPSLTLSEQLDVVMFLADEMLDALQRVESELIDVGMEVPQYVTKAIRRTKDDYKGKNPNGGRRAKFKQSRDYKRRAPRRDTTRKRYRTKDRRLLPSIVFSYTTPWYGWEIPT